MSRYSDARFGRYLRLWAKKKAAPDPETASSSIIRAPQGFSGPGRYHYTLEFAQALARSGQITAELLLALRAVEEASSQRRVALTHPDAHPLQALVQAAAVDRDLAIVR